jgi:RHS repeat-associated protein
LETSYRSSIITNSFVAFDGNGNVATLVNCNDGTITAHYEYGPFGEAVRATGPIAKTNPIRFSTKYQDETDLLYYGRRFYNTAIGQWLGRDPIREAGGANLYGFVHNNPCEFVDSIGEQCCSCSAGDLLLHVALGHTKDGSETVMGTIDEAKEFNDKVKKYIPVVVVKKLCKEIDAAIERVTKAADLAHKATAGAETIYVSTGLTFSYQVTLKYVCCGGNGLPTLKVQEQTLDVSTDGSNVQTQDGQYHLKDNSEMAQLGRDITATISKLVSRAKEDCKKQAKTSSGGGTSPAKN